MVVVVVVVMLLLECNTFGLMLRNFEYDIERSRRVLQYVLPGISYQIAGIDYARGCPRLVPHPRGGILISLG